MNKTLLVTTDFSEASINALNYACAFADQYNFNIFLTRIFTIPSNYAGEGVSLATINDAMEADNQRLKDEMDRVKNTWNKLTIEAKMVVGDFLEALNAFKKDLDPQLIIMGAIGEYSELWLWDDDWLNALITVACPVLVIPNHIKFHAIRKIAFACDYKRACSPEQVDVVINLAKQTSAAISMIHVTPKIGLKESEHIEVYKKAFESIRPSFFTIENKQIIKGIGEFVRENQVDILLVIPRVHGLWHSLFNKSYTRQLAKLNHLPVMAIHEVQ